MTVDQPSHRIAYLGAAFREAAQDTAVAAPSLAPAPAAETRQQVLAPQAAPILSAWLMIELDRASHRFVQTLVDPANGAVLRRYPDEGQLAFSRGVEAYLKVLAFSAETVP